MSSGNIALLKALQEFRPRGEASFKTYASSAVRNAMIDALAEARSVVRVPNTIQKRLRHWHRTARDLAQTLGRRPTVDEIDAASGLSRVELQTLRKALLAVSSVRPGVLDYGRELADRSIDHENDFEQAENADALRESLRARVRRLSPHELVMLFRTLGLGSYEEQSPLSIARERGTTRQAVSQAVRIAIRKLREP